jgi:hypothetical protein
VQQRLRRFQVRRIEALVEPAMHRREELARFGVPPLVTPEPGEARGGAQLPMRRLLAAGDRDRLAKMRFGGVGIPASEEKLAVGAAKVRLAPAFVGCLELAQLLYLTEKGPMSMLAP